MAQATMGHSALDVAKWFINATDRDAGDAITHLKVQKLVYYAQGWALAHFDRALFSDDLQAWAHGPVAVPVYNRFRGFSFDAIPKQKIDVSFNDNAFRLLTAVNDKYGIYSAKQLERMTHKEAPWKDVRGDLPPEARCTEIIPKAAMRKYFKSLLN
jgi:uncharacterized phage-associated protein